MSQNDSMCFPSQCEELQRTHHSCSISDIQPEFNQKTHQRNTNWGTCHKKNDLYSFKKRQDNSMQFMILNFLTKNITEQLMKSELSLR